VRVVRLSVLSAGIALGVVAEWAALHRPSFAAAATGYEQRVAAADFVVGLVLIACGIACRRGRRESRIGILLIVSGFAWFLGTFATSSFESVADVGALFVTLHRGPLVHAVLTYPSGRLRDRFEGLVVAAAYATSAVAVVGQRSGTEILLGCVVVLTAARASARAVGPRRRARRPALAAAIAFAAVLEGAGIVTLVNGGDAGDRAVLWAYQAVIVVIAVGLTFDLLRSRWAEATVTDLVVELGAVSEEGVLRERLAAALGDRSLTIGYWIPEEGAFVDERGGLAVLPESTSHRQVTVVRDAGEPVAALVHDAGALEEQGLADAVAAALRIAVANIRLRRQIARQVEEIEASRRRIVEAADVQRRRLERAMREGPERRLEEIEQVLASAQGDGADPATLAEALAELGTARTELGELAQGIHPRLLIERGLGDALADLARRAPVRVELHVSEERVNPAVAATAYFICSESLANVGKHARAAHATIRIERVGARLVVTVRDDGGGGARLEAGSGLRGLADRVEALGGRFRLDSRPEEGTTVVAELPVDEL